MSPTHTYIRASVEKMTPYVPGEQPTGGKIIKLNTNENPYPPSPDVKTCLQHCNPADLRRYPDPVSAGIRGILADRFGVRADQVFVGNGSDEILALCTRAFLENDAGAGHFSPSYSLYPVLADIRDVQCVATELGEGFTWTSPETRGCSLFFLANPNAPTGMLFDPAVVRDFCASFAGVVVIDEAYAEFSDRDCMSLVKEFANVIVVRTLSKSYSLAGIRLGYAVGSAELISALFKIKDSYNVNGLTQRVAEAALRDPATMLQNVSRICATRDRLRAELEKMHFEVLPSQANFLFVKPPDMPAKDLFEALREKGILIRYFAGPRVDAYVRITIGTNEEIDCLIEEIRSLSAPSEA